MWECTNDDQDGEKMVEHGIFPSTKEASDDDAEHGMFPSAMESSDEAEHGIFPSAKESSDDAYTMALPLEARLLRRLSMGVSLQPWRRLELRTLSLPSCV